MAKLTYGFNGGGQAFNAAAVNTKTFTSTDIPGAGVVKYIIDFDGAGNDLNDIDRVRVKAGGPAFYDVPISHHRAYLQRMSRNNVAPALTNSRISLPLYLMEEKGDARYAFGFPGALAPTVEIVTLASIAAGNIFAGWAKRIDAPLTGWAKFLASASTTPAGTKNIRHPITQDGLIRGFCLTTTALDRVKLVLRGEEIVNLTGEMLIESQAQENAIEGLSTQLFFKLEEALPAAGGDSYLELDTAAGWTPNSDISIFSILPQ